MAPSFAHLPPYAKAAFIAAQLDALAGPDEPIEDPFEPPTEALTEQQDGASLEKPVEALSATAPEKRPRNKKKRKLAASARAKAVLRAAKKPNRRIEPDDSDSSFEHHRRKCQVCNHPDREAIEELFIAWHSPRSIRIEFGTYHRLDCSSIYRHARAAGLYAKRRKNLRAVFDLILEHAGNIAPTAHGIVAIVRAYSCLTDTHDWIEPERRVHVVNHIYRHDAPASTKEVENGPSFRAPYPHDVVPSESALANSQPLSSQVFVGGGRFHRPAPSETDENPSSDVSTSVATASLSGGRSFSSDIKTVENDSPFLAFRPPCPERIRERGDVAARPASICHENVEAFSSYLACPDSSIGAPHPRDVLSSVPADSQSIPSAFAAPPVLAVSGGSSVVHSGSLAGAPGLRQASQSEEIAKGGTSSAPSSLESPLATSHSPLATRISNRHTPEIRIASNPHKTNNRNISNRHISHSVSTQPQKEKSPKTSIASGKDNLAG